MNNYENIVNVHYVTPQFTRPLERPTIKSKLAFYKLSAVSVQTPEHKIEHG